jgi:2-(1,2-epoxy-1,2-dihydrophenyl)acetyl-CoA isomerase
VTEIDTGSADLLASVEAGVGTVVLNRPASRNAITGEMLTVLGEVLERFDRAPEVGAIVLTGAGGAFCSGGDVSGFADRGGDTPVGTETSADWCVRRLATQRATVGRLHATDTPSIAALTGATAGAGLSLALACDLRVGSPSTMVSSAFVKVGLPGDFGVSWLLRRLVGPSTAARVMLLSERLDGDQAAALGLIDFFVPADQVGAEAQRLGAVLAAAPRGAVAAIRQNLRDGAALDLDAAMVAEVRRYRACADSTEHQDAVRAFAESRRAKAGRA